MVDADTDATRNDPPAAPDEPGKPGGVRDAVRAATRDGPDHLRTAARDAPHSFRAAWRVGRRLARRAWRELRLTLARAERQKIPGAAGSRSALRRGGAWARKAAGEARRGGRSARVLGVRAARSGRRWAARELRRTRVLARRVGMAAAVRGRRAAARWGPVLAAQAARIPRPSRAQWGAAAVVVSVLAVAAWSRCGVRGCPDVGVLRALQPGGAPELLDRSGEPFGRLTLVDRIVVPLDTLPEHVPAAFLAVEDRRFHRHDGVDWLRVPGALLANLRSGEVREGFSTITMQLARNVFPERLPGRERTLGRKLLEIRVAGEIEDRYQKPEILELYLNHVYFGGGAYGIHAAARHWFGTTPERLSLAQAALLAALLKAPGHYDPRSDPDRARERRDLVLTLMARQERVSQDEAAAAREEELGVLREPVPRPPEELGPAPWFVEAVRRELEARFGSSFYAERLRIHTTLDLEVQRALSEELGRQVRRIEAGAFGRFRGEPYRAGLVPDPGGTTYLQGAGVVLDARTGDVLAHVGGRDFVHSPFDRVLYGTRQVGSAFKPFVYAAAVEAGWMPVRRVEDRPLRMALSGRRVYEPRNYSGDFRGSVSLREALVHSLNVPAVRVADAVGRDRVAALAARTGLDAPISLEPSMALGTVATSPLALAVSYAAFAGLGRAPDGPRWVRLIQDAGGREVWRASDGERPVLDPAVAWVVTDMLRDVVDQGTGRAVRAAGYRGPAAGKTGTTSDGKDVWFVGYTPDLVGTVWLGFDRPEVIVADASGGALAAPVWGRTLAQVYRSRPEPADWPVPPGVVRLSVHRPTGTVLASWCRAGDRVEEVFLEGAVPPAGCPAVPERRGRFRSVITVVEGWLDGILGRGGRDGGDGG